MTEVLTPAQSDSPFSSRPLSRSSSQTALYLHGHGYQDAQPAVFSGARGSSEAKPAASIPSSAPSSPRLVNNDSSSQPSLLSTPSSSLSLDEQYLEAEEDDILFPSYEIGKQGTVTHVKSKEAKPKRKQVQQTSRRASRDHSEMPEVPLKPDPSFVSMGDDAAVRKEPSRHVDYLSHHWNEEDVWCSWRHVVARRKELSEAPRLENACWRSWTKSQRRLNTLQPEKLNWMKDHDVTWLYGPLSTLDPQIINPDSPTARSRLSRTNSFLSRKPILKRRSVSEAMLQRSLSNSTLVRQAVDCIASQETTSPPRPGVLRRTSSRFSEQITPPAPSPHPTLDHTPSELSSGSETPATERKHIHFNDKVEQCIAVDKDLEDAEDFFRTVLSESDESSDDGVLMMQTSHSKERKLSNASNGSRSSFSTTEAHAKSTIAMLPATTLKYRRDTPEPPERHPTPKVSDPRWLPGRGLQHSSSSETLKPSKPSNNFLIDEDDEADLDWQPSPSTSFGSRGSGGGYYSEGGIPIHPDESEDEELEARGMRRTPSGMFMPYDGDEGDAENSSIFGKVVDTVNTARDIAHVIWNVGWRR